MREHYLQKSYRVAVNGSVMAGQLQDYGALENNYMRKIRTFRVGKFLDLEQTRQSDKGAIRCVCI